jgi:hypothetical protein
MTWNRGYLLSGYGVLESLYNIAVIQMFSISHLLLFSYIGEAYFEKLEAGQSINDRTAKIKYPTDIRFNNS